MFAQENFNKSNYILNFFCSIPWLKHKYKNYTKKHIKDQLFKEYNKQCNIHLLRTERF